MIILLIAIIVFLLGVIFVCLHRQNQRIIYLRNKLQKLTGESYEIRSFLGVYIPRHFGPELNYNGGRIIPDLKIKLDTLYEYLKLEYQTKCQETLPKIRKIK